MTISPEKFTPQERITLKLRRLYEQYGFMQYRMSRFEEYRLYLENQTFLGSEQVITFTDLDGRLLALRPDVTLSIVKNADEQAGVQRLYYIENVYRVSKESHTFREIGQMGLELLGCVDDYARTQVVDLALASLAEIGQPYMLDLSHMKFVVGMLEGMAIPRELHGELLDYIGQKNLPALRSFVRTAGITQDSGDILCTLPELYGEFMPTLQRARKIAIGEAANKALDELETIYAASTHPDKQSHLRLDFSVINHIDYYNGVIFQGFVEGLARHTLSGGQYDCLMERLGKKGGAMGFALYLDEIYRLPDQNPHSEADILLIYDPSTPAQLVSKQVEEWVNSGKTVQVYPHGAPCKVVCKKTMLMDKTGVQEVGSC